MNDHARARPDRWSRRRFLEIFGLGGTGILAGLPLLESLPAFADDSIVPRRLLLLFTPNGSIIDEFFVPTADGTVQLGRILQPLAPFRDQLLLLDGLSMGVTALGPGNEHQRGMAAWLTGQPNGDGMFCGGSNCVSGRSGWAAGASIDQLVAQRNAGETAIPSLELGVRVEGTDNRHRMSYTGAERPIAPDHDPRSVYRRLFGQSDAELAPAICVSDRLALEYRALSARVSGPDRERLQAHLAAVESIQARLQSLAAAPSCDAQEPRALDVSDEANYPALTALQTDLLITTFRCDVTRVASLMWSGATSKVLPRWLNGRTYPDLSFDTALSHSFHSYTHDPFRDPRESEQAEVRLKLLTIYRWYAGAVARILEGLQNVTERDGSTLLDNTLVLWGSELSAPDVHSFDRMPFVVAGGRKFLKTGRYVDLHGEQHTALLATLASVMGLPDLRFGHPDFAREPLYQLLR